MSRQFDVAAGGDASSGEVPCARCGERMAEAAIDRWGWCPKCRRWLERRARRGQRVVAALITLPFLVWILVEGTGGVLPLYAWALPLLAAWYLGSRIGRVLVRNYLRSQREA